MGRLFGMHELELRPGVEAATFERFVAEDLSKMLHREGQQTYVLKGDRGDRAGKYLFVFEYDSVESRDRDSPGSNQDSQELLTWLEEHRGQVGALFEKLSTFVRPDRDIGIHYTDYVTVE
jgi:hypothetical protein